MELNLKKHFKHACEQLNIPSGTQDLSTPSRQSGCLSDSTVPYREEFVDMIDIGLEDINEFNQRLTPWLIEYNSVRPHQALDYLTPLEYIELHPQKKVLPMSPSCTRT